MSECIAYLSEYETLEPGDLIMTGTPEGVDAVVAGDTMRGAIAGLGAIEYLKLPRNQSYMSKEMLRSTAAREFQLAWGPTTLRGPLSATSRRTRPSYGVT